MSNYDDLFSRRVGGSVGKNLERTTLDTIGADGINSFRTAIRNTQDGTVRVRTKGGTPEIVFAPNASSVTYKPVNPEAFIEKDFSGNITQNDRLYFHDVPQGSANEVRLYSPDGLYSIKLTPLMRITILMQTATADTMLDVWLNDFTPKDPAHPKDTTGIVQVSGADNAQFNVVRDGIRLIEQTSSVLASELDEDEVTPAVSRKYFKQVFIAPSKNDVFTPLMNTYFFGFLVRRIKRMAFSTSRCAGVVLSFVNYNEDTDADDLGIGATGYAEALFTDRAYSPRLTGTKLSGVPLLLAGDGGVLEPMNVPTNNLIKLTQATSDPAKRRPLTSLSDVVAFGQPWHGYLEGKFHYDLSTLVYDEITLWDSPSKTRALLTNNHLSPTKFENLMDPNVFDAFFHYDFGLTMPNGIGLGPSGAAFSTDVRFTNGYYSPLKDSLPITGHDSDSAVVLYRDDNKAVWRILIAKQKTATEVSITATLYDRIDDFFGPAVSINRVLGTQTLFTYASLATYTTPEEVNRLRVKNRPDGKEAAAMVIDDLDTNVPKVIAYSILSFSGNGVTTTSGADGNVGDGITCTFSAVGTPLSAGPIGKASNQSSSDETFPIPPNSGAQDWVTFNYPALNMRPVFFTIQYLGSKTNSQTVTILDPNTQSGFNTREIWDAEFNMQLVPTGVTKIGNIHTSVSDKLLDIYYQSRSGPPTPFRFTTEIVAPSTVEEFSGGGYEINATFSKDPVFRTTEGTQYMASWSLPSSSVSIGNSLVLRSTGGFKATYTLSGVASHVDDHIVHFDRTYTPWITNSAGVSDSDYVATTDASTGTVFPPWGGVTAGYSHQDEVPPSLGDEITLAVAAIYPAFRKTGTHKDNCHPAWAAGTNVHATELYFDGVKSDTAIDLTYLNSIVWTCDPKTRKPIILPPDTHAMIF